MADTKPNTSPAGGQTQAQVDAAKLAEATKSKTQPESKPKMQVRSCRVKLSKDQDVPLKEITPAEACLLVAEHHRNVGDSAIYDLGPVVRTHTEKVFVDGKHTDNKVTKTEITEVERTVVEEIANLKGKYGVKKVTTLFPGAIPQLPQTFKEAIEIGITTVLPEE